MPNGGSHSDSEEDWVNEPVLPMESEEDVEVQGPENDDPLGVFEPEPQVLQDSDEEDDGFEENNPVFVGEDDSNSEDCTTWEFNENQKADTQMSFYAASKKAAEVLSHSYSHIHQIPMTIFV